MDYFYAVRIPANTTAGAPYKKILLISFGVITGIQINIPEGHLGKAHLVMELHGSQVFPLSRQEDYHGNKTEIKFNTRINVDSAPYELKAVGWNSDTLYAHEFQISIELSRLDMLGSGIGSISLGELADIIGEVK